MSTIEFIPEPRRKFFTWHSLLPVAITQLKAYSIGARNIADGDAQGALYARKLTGPNGGFKMDRLEAQSLVTAAYAEGWHEKY